MFLIEYNTYYNITLKINNITMALMKKIQLYFAISYKMVFIICHFSPSLLTSEP